MDPRVTSLGQQWMEANPWYDPRGSNEDSAVTNAIDTRLVAEGYNPASVAYWEELTRRVSARINTDDTPPSRDRKRAPPMGTSREHVPPSTKKAVFVTPDRKQAMIEAGVWDDPVRRAQMLKAYQAYDRNPPR